MKTHIITSTAEVWIDEQSIRIEADYIPICASKEEPEEDAAKPEECDLVSIGVEKNGGGGPLIVLTSKQGRAVSIPVTDMEEWISIWREREYGRAASNPSDSERRAQLAEDIRYLKRRRTIE